MLDISASALELAKLRLGPRATAVELIVADVTTSRPARTYDIWHDRAVFHFMTEEADRAAYVKRLADALVEGGLAVIATFAPDGPDRCSGLPVVRYAYEMLAETLGPRFELRECSRFMHSTPWGAQQSFQISLFRKTSR